MDDFRVPGAVKGAEIGNVECVEAAGFRLSRGDEVEEVVDGSTPPRSSTAERSA
jgi:hypothetical protein